MYSIKKFTEHEVNSIINALDTYGFDSIIYMPRYDIYYVLFNGEANLRNDSDAAIEYLKKNVTGRSWVPIEGSAHSRKYFNDINVNVMSYTGFNKEVCI